MGGTGGSEGGSTGPRAVGNELSGNVEGPVVQAGAVHGDVSITYQVQREPRPAEVPHQVPACVAGFVNRVSELSAMGGWLAPETAGSSRIVVLSGLPGVGKSMTARRWTESVRGRFPGGELYVDFAALRDRAGADVSEGLGSCLRALGVAEQYLPAGLAERAGLFRTRTAGRPVLVVLDDVTEPAQVSALVPNAPGSAVLVTSNRRLDELRLDGARLMELEPLDADSGRHLLGVLCGEDRVRAEPEAAAALVDRCAGLPVALHVAAARLLARRRLTMAGLVAELADESRRLAAFSVRGERRVSAVFAFAYRDLPPDSARLYRRLGLLPGRTFDLPTAVIAAGTDADTDAVQGLLDGLETAGLLDDPSSDGGRYRFHDLVRLYARERATEDEPESEREALLLRVVDHYLTRAAFADRAVMGGDRLRIADHAPLLGGRTDPFDGPDARRSGLAWLEAERADVLAVLRTAAGHGGLDRQTWQLAEALTALYLNHRHLADWIEACTLGARAAARDRNPAAEARLRSLLSRPLLDTDRLDRARTELETAAALADDSGHPVLRASVQEFLGRYWDRADPARAVEVYRRSLALNTEAGEPRGAAIALYFLGCSQDASGDHEAGLATLRDALERLRGLGDRRMAGRALIALGQAYDQLGDAAEAARVLLEAVRDLRELGASHYEAQALEALADIAERAGDRAALRRHLTRALEIHEGGGSPRADLLRGRLAAVTEG